MKREDLEKLAGDPLSAANAETAARVFSEATLWPAFEDVLYPNAEPTDEERAVIRRVVSERCGATKDRRASFLSSFVAERLARLSGEMSDFALAAARADAGAKRQEAASEREEEPVAFVFVSDVPDGGAATSPAWRAEMTLPPHAAVDTMLPIVVTDRAGAPVAGGIFKVAGVALPIRDGRAEIPYGMFLTGLKDAQVELVTERGVRAPGTLALF